MPSPPRCTSTSRQVFARSRPVSRLETWAWKPPRALPTRGLTTQVFYLKSNTAYIMALKNNPDTCSSAPSLLRIIVIIFQTSLACDKFLTTAGQSSSDAEITHPRYQNEATISRR